MFDGIIDLMKESVDPIGCVIISGTNTTLYTVCGTEITQHHSIDVSLPNKQGRGGQSQKRFERLGNEARHPGTGPSGLYHKNNRSSYSYI